MVFSSILGKLSSDLAIDLGTSNTLIYMKGKGIVLNEPSVVALRKGERGADRILAVGKEAKKMLGRTPEKVEAIRPIQDGVIADFEITQEMLRFFIKRVHSRNVLMRPRIIVAVPIGVTPVEKKAILECARSAGASEVYLIEEPMAAAIGAGLPITEPTGSMVIDIGGGTTEVAVISLGGIVYSKSVRVAGNKMDEAMVQYINRNYNFLIGPSTAEHIKMTIGNAFPGEDRQSLEVRGRDLVTGIPKILTLDSEEVRQMIVEELNTIIQVVRSALEQMPPELSGDILDRGIVLTGGGALLKNMDKLLREETKVPIAVTEDPLSAVVHGAGPIQHQQHVARHQRIAAALDRELGRGQGAGKVERSGPAHRDPFGLQDMDKLLQVLLRRAQHGGRPRAASVRLEERPQVGRLDVVAERVDLRRLAEGLGERKHQRQHRDQQCDALVAAVVPVSVSSRHAFPLVERAILVH